MPHASSSECSSRKPKKVRIVVEDCPMDKFGETCSCHKVGDTYEFDFERCPQNFCASAFHSLWPSLRVLELGGRHPWDTEENVTHVACPDSSKPTIFRIEVYDE